MPAPKPDINTRSPRLTRPSSIAATSASGIEPADVLPVLCNTVQHRSGGMPSLSAADLMMRMLAWWGTSHAISSAVTPAFFIAISADDTMARTAALEDLATFHAQLAAVVAIEDAPRAAVGAEVEAEQRLLVARLDDDGAAAIGEEDGRAAVGPIGDVRQACRRRSRGCVRSRG